MQSHLHSSIDSLSALRQCQYAIIEEDSAFKPNNVAMLRSVNRQITDLIRDLKDLQKQPWLRPSE